MADHDEVGIPGVENAALLIDLPQRRSCRHGDAPVIQIRRHPLFQLRKGRLEPAHRAAFLQMSHSLRVEHHAAAGGNDGVGPI